jgi:hypothetical protein
LKATYYVNRLLSSFYTCIKISMTLEAWNTRMDHGFNFIRKFKLRLLNHLLYECGSFSQRMKNFCFFITSRSYNGAFLKRISFFTFNLNIEVRRFFRLQLMQSCSLLSYMFYCLTFIREGSRFVINELSTFLGLTRDRPVHVRAGVDPVTGRIQQTRTDAVTDTPVVTVSFVNCVNL